MKRLASLICIAGLMSGPVSADELSDLRMKVDALEQRLNTMGTASAAPAPAGTGWQASYNTGGGGFQVASPDKDFVLKILGYVQTNFNYWDREASEVRRLNGTTARRVSNDFSVRRARMDWLATLHKTTEFFVEFDGGPAGAAGASDFGLIEARLTQKFCEAFSLRVGKFTTPFSTENSRSSRALDTAERYVALNSLFGLPATDVQFGAMALGNFTENRFGYFLGAFNGNGRANDNLRDTNSAKEVQGKFIYRPWEGLGKAYSKAAIGLGVDWNREQPGQTLALSTLGGARLATLGTSNIHGNRLGYSADIHYPCKRLDVRAEGLVMNFDNDSSVDSKLYGGFAQVGYEVWRSGKGASFAPLVRAETAVISNELTGGSARLNSLTVGWNAWLNPNVRWQLNYIPSSFSSKGAVTGAVANQHFDEVISQIQFKI